LENPIFDFVFICGTDLLNSIRSWEFGQELLNEFEFIICDRNKYIPLKENYPRKYRVLEKNIEVSSTEIRKKIRENFGLNHLGISEFTTISVIEYIVKNKLYSHHNNNNKNNFDDF